MQAESAGDPGIRRMMRAIARDEFQRAALAWRVAAWLEERLDAHANARVRAAREAALQGEMARDEPGDALLGLPPTRDLRAALANMRATFATGRLAA